MARRDVASRDASWARRTAAMLARADVRPNTISIASIWFSAAAALAFAAVPHVRGTVQVALLAGAAAGMQLRLVCNLLDGMVAVEHGQSTPTGALYNEVPDRLADVLILVGAGLSLAPEWPGAVLGGAAAIGALFTAYVRLLGASLTGRQDFSGPMAKQHRMFVLTVAAISGVVRAGLVLIAVGSAVTAARRLRRIAADLEGR